MLKKLKSYTTKVAAAFLMLVFLVSSVGASAAFAMEMDNPEIVPPAVSMNMVVYDAYGNWEDVEAFALPALKWKVVKNVLGWAGIPISLDTIVIQVVDGIVESVTGTAPFTAMSSAIQQAMDGWRAGLRHLVVRHVIALPCGSWPLCVQSRQHD